MSVVTGGLRARLIRDSLYNMINAALVDLGWFDSGRQHKPVQFMSEPLDASEAIAPNSLGLGTENVDDLYIELGSLLSDHSWFYWLELFADSTTLGLHLSGDLKDILEGRISSIGRTRPNFVVYDYRQATPPELFTCQIEDVNVDMTTETGQSWRATWYGISFMVVDTYGTEDDV